MIDSLTIRIAEIPLCLELACGDATRAKIAERYAPFSIPPVPDALTLRIEQKPGSPFIPLKNDGTAWQIRTAEKDGRIDFESHYERGWLDRSAARGELTLRSDGDAENFLRVVYAWLVLERSGLLLHAAGVISNGKGYVFFGHSGSGKTTTARLSLTANKTVLSDDLVIITRRGEKFWLYGVPFRGDFPEAPRVNADAELAGMFTLVKDTEHRLESLAMPEALARLAACVPFVMAQPAQSNRVMETCAALAARVPVRAMHFRRDPGFWEVIDAGK